MPKRTHYDPRRHIVPEVYGIIKAIGFAEGTDEFDAVMAAYVLGQSHMRDRAISALGSYEANRCAQVVAGIKLCNGWEVE